MQVVLHTGVHFTDEERLLNSLIKNRTLLAERGVSAPKPSSYRRQIRSLLHNVRKNPLDATAREKILNGMKDPSIAEPERIVLSNSNFFGVPRLAVRDNVYYPGAEERLQDFCGLFHSDEVEIFLAVRNPATFLPALLAGCPEDTIEEITEGSAPTALRWSEMVARIRTGLPNAAITVWCNEDTPLIWEQILRELAGFDASQPMEGGNDLLGEIMTPAGLERFASYLESHQGMTEMQKRRVIAAFLDKFAIEDEVEEELDIPGWTEDYIDALTEIYDEDLYEISRIQGVNLITP